MKLTFNYKDSNDSDNSVIFYIDNLVLAAHCKYFENLFKFHDINVDQLQIDIDELGLDIAAITTTFKQLIPNLDSYTWINSKNRVTYDIIVRSNKPTKNKYHPVWHLPYLESIEISAYLELFKVASYFMIDDLFVILKNNLTKYLQLFSTFYSIDQNFTSFQKQKNNNIYKKTNVGEFILDTYTIRTNDIDPAGDIKTCKKLKKLFHIKYFIDNLYPIYRLAKEFRVIDIFDYICKEISADQEISHLTDNESILPIEISQYEHNIPFEEYYELSKLPSTLVIRPEIYDLFTFTDEITHLTPKWPRLRSENQPDIKIGQKVLYTKSEFEQRFQSETKGYFDGINWDHMIMSGGFIFGLMNKAQNSIIGSTDIDLFIYGDEDEKKSKMTYLLEFFSQYKPYYALRGSVLNIIIANLGFDIQIICTKYTDKNSIIKEFDLSYIQLYYDSTSIYATLDCLASFCYQCVTIVDPKKKKNLRIFKTLLKGLSIKNDECLSDFDFNKYSNPDLIASLHKPKIIRQILAYSDNTYNNQFIIKSLYRYPRATVNYSELIDHIDVRGDFDGYRNGQKKTAVKNSLINLGAVGFELDPVRVSVEVTHFDIKYDNNFTSRNFSFKITDIKEYKIATEYSKPNCAVMIITIKRESEECQKLLNFSSLVQNKLKKFIKNKKNRGEFRVFKKWNNVQDDDDDDDDDTIKSTEMSLAIHLPETVYNGMKDLDQTANNRLTASLNGRIWMSKDYKTGIKFTAEHIDIIKSHPTI